jgi:hypothetical protein
MSEARFIGGVAGSGLTRTTHTLKSSFYTQTGGPVGYGIYLTDKSLIGVSYQKLVSKAYRPAYVLFLIWIVSLILLIVYATLTGAKESLLLPFLMILPVVDLALIVYWSPKQASKKIEQATVTTIEDLQKSPSDIVLKRADISSITLRTSLITILTKSGESHTFPCHLRRPKMRELLTLLKEFCQLTPSIDLLVSDSSGKNVQRMSLPTS